MASTTKNIERPYYNLTYHIQRCTEKTNKQTKQNKTKLKTNKKQKEKKT